MGASGEEVQVGGGVGGCIDVGVLGGGWAGSRGLD